MTVVSSLYISFPVCIPHRSVAGVELRGQVLTFGRDNVSRCGTTVAQKLKVKM